MGYLPQLKTLFAMCLEHDFALPGCSTCTYLRFHLLMPLNPFTVATPAAHVFCLDVHGGLSLECLPLRTFQLHICVKLAPKQSLLEISYGTGRHA